MKLLLSKKIGCTVKFMLRISEVKLTRTSPQAKLYRKVSFTIMDSFTYPKGKVGC